MRLRRFAVGLLLALPLAAHADDDSLKSLGTALRPVLVKSLPPVLYEKSTNWGHQELAPNGLRWRRLRRRSSARRRTTANGASFASPRRICRERWSST